MNIAQWMLHNKCYPMNVTQWKLHNLKQWMLPNEIKTFPKKVRNGCYTCSK